MTRGLIVHRRRLAWGVLWTLVSCCAGGCGIVQTALGMVEGHLLQAQDVLALPGREIVLRVRLESGSFLRDEEDRTVRFMLQGKPHAQAVTDDEGFVEARFTPPAPGDYRFSIEVPAAGIRRAWSPTHLLVCCRAADAPITIVDLDGTLMQPDTKRMLLGELPPLENSVEVLTRLARDRTIVYLTHRPKHFDRKSKDWLAKHRFPPGPVLLSDIRGFVKGSQRYKEERLHELRARFTNIRLGVGNTHADAMAYRANGLQAVLLFHARSRWSARKLEEQADQIGSLQADVQVTHDWAEVRSLLWEGAKFPPSRVQQELLQQARKLRGK